MTKNELMEMAIAAEAITKGKVTIGEGGTAFGMRQLVDFANALLERAAVECEEFGHNEDRPYDYGYRIRALKLPTN